MNFKAFHESLRGSKEWRVAGEAPKFFMGEVEDIERLPDCDRKFPRLPYSRCVFEMRDSGLSSFILALADARGPHEDSVVLGVFAAMKDPQGTVLFNGKALPIATVRVRHSDDCVNTKINEVLLQHELISEESATNQTLNFVAWLARFLAVVNCVNVKTELVAQRKPHVAGAPRADYSYHVLVLRRRSASNLLGGSHAPPRLHLRRGHIKHRRTGDFWWQPCVVGRSSDGVVEKEYDGSYL